MKTTRTFHIDYDRDAEGWWVASARGVQGCHTQGKTIEQARTRIREALAVSLEEAGSQAIARAATLIDHVKLPAAIRSAVKAAEAARKRSEQLEAKAKASTESAVQALVKAGVSMRDAGEILSLTRQRVHQIAQGRRA